jgi:hypothetical protein
MKVNSAISVRTGDRSTHQCEAFTCSLTRSIFHGNIFGISMHNPSSNFRHFITSIALTGARFKPGFVKQKLWLGWSEGLYLLLVNFIILFLIYKRKKGNNRIRNRYEIRSREPILWGRCGMELGYPPPPRPCCFIYAIFLRAASAGMYRSVV